MCQCIYILISSLLVNVNVSYIYSFLYLFLNLSVGFFFFTFFAGRLPIYSKGESSRQTFTEILRQELAVHEKELKSANAMIDGYLVRRKLTLCFSCFCVDC